MMLALLLCVAAATINASLTHPPVLPLFVRNPYLSAWLGDARQEPWKSWPIFWNGETLGFSVLASLPRTKQLYPLFGQPQHSLATSSGWYNITEPVYEGASFDASNTNFTYRIETWDSTMQAHTKITLSFLSPITPTSTITQSLPAAYLTVYVEGPEGVDIYVDINGQWATGDKDATMFWDLYKDSSSSTQSWRISQRQQSILGEKNDRASWGTVHFTGPLNAAFQSGFSESVRLAFAQRNQLLNVSDSRYRAVFDKEPVFAFSIRLTPSVGDHAFTSTTFSIGLSQDPVAQFAAARGLTYMRPLWASRFHSAEEMISHHYRDFNSASRLALDFSHKLEKDAYVKGGESYVDIVALSARQVLGATQFSGTSDEPILFLKEISSNGNFQTVDVIFPSFPFFLYTNPRWLAYLLAPLIEHQLSGQYPNNYSMHDLGTHFPNATGHPDGLDEYMPVEECGNMLIMALALINALRDGGMGLLTQQPIDTANYKFTKLTAGETEAHMWTKNSYALLKQWAGYLVREALMPQNQLTTDDFAGRLANSTNLALKGIIGIKSMSRIANIVDEKDDARFYSDVATEYIEKWQSLAFSRDRTHAKLTYDWFGSWTTLYNLFADALLCFHTSNEKTSGTSKGPKSSTADLSNNTGHNFIPDRIYSLQSNWYLEVIQRFGLPLDSRHLYAKSDWEFFAAAVSGKTTLKSIIASVARWINETVTGWTLYGPLCQTLTDMHAKDRPLTDLYDTEGKGDFSAARFMARPVVGGHFAPLALEGACEGRAVTGLMFLDYSEDDESWGNEGEL